MPKGLICFAPRLIIPCIRTRETYLKIKVVTVSLKIKRIKFVTFFHRNENKQFSVNAEVSLMTFCLEFPNLRQL